jgi:hypothetical protein
MGNNFVVQIDFCQIKSLEVLFLWHVDLGIAFGDFDSIEPPCCLSWDARFARIAIEPGN